MITVKAHRGKMMQKMKAGSLAGLAQMAVKLPPGIHGRSNEQPDFQTANKNTPGNYECAERHFSPQSNSRNATLHMILTPAFIG